MRPRTLIFAFAIEDYQETAFRSVIYAEQDAQAFVAAWREMGVNPVDAVLLLGDQATRSELRSSLRKTMSMAGPDDRVVLFFVGHGAALRGATSVFAAFDTRAEDVEKSGIPLAEILNEIRQTQSRQVLLFMDVCHGAIQSISGTQPCSPVLEGDFAVDELRAFCKESLS
ncbi:MAG TPA: caspase family protein, partial [Pirellula sp.]|nr:caspase family protein [Pirellula sp.]